MVHLAQNNDPVDSSFVVRLFPWLLKTVSSGKTEKSLKSACM
jgi:hypothetical protein